MQYKVNNKQIDDFIEFAQNNCLSVDSVILNKGKIVSFSGDQCSLDNLKPIQNYLKASKLYINFISFNIHRYQISVEYSLFVKLKELFI